MDSNDLDHHDHAAAVRSADAYDAAPTPAAERQPRPHILVVDDHPLVARTMARLLRRHDVVTDTDPHHALERIAAGERFDLIFCDLAMPELQGWELQAMIEAVAPDQARAMVFITGGAATDAARAFLARTTSPCLEKPCSIDQLEAAVAAHGGRTRAAR